MNKFNFYFYLTLILLINSTLIYSQNNRKIKGPLLLFDRYELFDTLCLSEIEKYQTNGKYIPVVLRFTNVGTEPLIINYWTNTGDQYYINYLPKDPIKPGNRDSIIISTSPHKPIVYSEIIVKSNSIIPQHIIYRRTYKND